MAFEDKGRIEMDRLQHLIFMSDNVLAIPLLSVQREVVGQKVRPTMAKFQSCKLEM